MRSWLFRHRLRLRAIYAPRAAPEPVPAAPRPARERDGLRPGDSAWRGRYFVIRPANPAA